MDPTTAAMAAAYGFSNGNNSGPFHQNEVRF